MLRREVLIDGAATFAVHSLRAEAKICPWRALAAPGTERLNAQDYEGEIQEIGTWDTGLTPNYTASFVKDNQTYVIVACWWTGSVDLINTTANNKLEIPLGLASHPLDVAYDQNRERIIVASDETLGRLFVLDNQYSLLKVINLGKYLNQGSCIGGAQGVTIDKDGHYWAALAYSNVAGGGAVVKVDSNTLEPQISIQHLGIENPNGIVSSENGEMIYVFSDLGFVHQFNAADGRLQRIIPSVYRGYRGTVDGDYVWTVGWLQPGKMVRFNQKTRDLNEFSCADLGNSIKVDSSGHVWVAGDSGVSVSTRDGRLLAFKPTASPTNGLTVIDDKVFYISYDQKLHQVAFVAKSETLASTSTPTPEPATATPIATATPTQAETAVASPTAAATPNSLSTPTTRRQLFFPLFPNSNSKP